MGCVARRVSRDMSFCENRRTELSREEVQISLSLCVQSAPILKVVADDDLAGVNLEP